MHKTGLNFCFFVQGGYAEPGLDAFDVNFEWYYIGGFKLSWNLGGYYTLKKSTPIAQY